MDTTSIEVISTHGSLNVYKCNRGWKRPLVLTVHGRYSKQNRYFPETDDNLRLDDAFDDGNCLLSVRPSGLKRLLHEPKFLIAAAPSRKRVVISGSGRCGTQAIARFLDGLQHENGHRVISRHETMHEYILPLLINGETQAVAQMVEGMQHHIESAPHFALYPSTLSADVILHVVRDGRRVVQSGMNRGWYAKDSLWNRIKPVFSDDRFENCCHLWRVTTENMLRAAQHTFRLEDLIGSHEERQRLANMAGVVATKATSLPHVNQGTASSEYQSWSTQEMQKFADICGPMMDVYYPGWDRYPGIENA